MKEPACEAGLPAPHTHDGVQACLCATCRKQTKRIARASEPGFIGCLMASELPMRKEGWHAHCSPNCKSTVGAPCAVALPCRPLVRPREQAQAHPTRMHCGSSSQKYGRKFLSCAPAQLAKLYRTHVLVNGNRRSPAVYAGDRSVAPEPGLCVGILDQTSDAKTIRAIVGARFSARSNPEIQRLGLYGARLLTAVGAIATCSCSSPRRPKIMRHERAPHAYKRPDSSASFRHMSALFNVYR